MTLEELKAETSVTSKTPVSPTQLGNTAILRGSLNVKDKPHHFGSLSLVVYIIGSGTVIDLLGRNKVLQSPWVSQPDESIRIGVNTPSHGPSLLRGNQQPGHKICLSQWPCVCDRGKPYSNHRFRLWSTYSLERDGLCLAEFRPGYTMNGQSQ